MKQIFSVLISFLVVISIHSQENLKTNKPSNFVIKKAEKMFADYLPKILKSKGEGSFIDMQTTHIGDFTNDGIEDIVIWFNYSLGGNLIAGYECAFYEVKGNDVKVVAGFQPNYIFTISEIKEGIIYINKSEYAEGDSKCCPSISTKVKLVFRGNKIIPIK